MTQEEKDFVSFETAKLLKDKGFDWEVRTFYVEDSDDRDIAISLKKVDYNHASVGFLSCPTQQMACRWLREEHKIHITTEPLEMFKQERIVYEPIIYLLNDFDDFALEYETVHLKECDTDEEAIELALEYTLTKLI